MDGSHSDKRQFATEDKNDDRRPSECSPGRRLLPASSSSSLPLAPRCQRRRRTNRAEMPTNHWLMKNLSCLEMILIKFHADRLLIIGHCSIAATCYYWAFLQLSHKYACMWIWVMWAFSRYCFSFSSSAATKVYVRLQHIFLPHLLCPWIMWSCLWNSYIIHFLRIIEPPLLMSTLVWIQALRGSY